MNILQSLGFKKKEAAQSADQTSDSPNRSEKNAFFSDKYPRAEGEKRIYNLIILDESGSMGPLRREALAGVNETIHTIRTAQQENTDDHQMLAFVTFDRSAGRPDVRVIIDNEKIECVADITPDQYQPNGMTPLYDAMGISFTALQRLVQEGDHVLVTVITDGFENASAHHTAESVKALVESLSTQGWVFTYIGANQDSEQTGAQIGIRSSMDFESSSEGVDLMFDKISSSHREYYKKVRESKRTGAHFDYDEDFFAQKKAASRITPEWIETLTPGQVFVFGSNTAGHHDGGAARLARERFGAIYGQAEGLHGQSYAIPTVGVSLPELRAAVRRFIDFADANPEMTFLVTRIGCGIAGYRDEEIAPMFARAYSLPNVHLPESFWRVLSYKF